MYLIVFIFVFIIILFLLFTFIKYKHSLKEIVYYEKDCIDRNSECSKEIRRRFGIYAENIDDFDISSESLNLMKVKILPNPGNTIAKFHYYSK